MEPLEVVGENKVAKTPLKTDQCNKLAQEKLPPVTNYCGNKPKSTPNDTCSNVIIKSEKLDVDLPNEDISAKENNIVANQSQGYETFNSNINEDNSYSKNYTNNTGHVSPKVIHSIRLTTCF